VLRAKSRQTKQNANLTGSVPICGITGVENPSFTKEKEMTTTKKQEPLTPEEIAELRAYVDAGIRSTSNTTLEEMERRSGPLKQSEILVYAMIGARKLREAEEA